MPDDGGPPRDTGPDTGHVDVCDRNEVCRDDLFCNGVEQCMPGATGADARGCVAGTPPCSAGDVCVEAEDRCESDDCADGGDGDGDGERRPECGGSDCDDSDGSRYPSNVEVCDAEGHDEDCNPATFGNTDADSDTFVSSACCNGDNCGLDCNDGDPDLNPSQVEICDGADDDCSGVADDAGGLCPGGSCIAGQCDFDAWDRTFGGTMSDSGEDVAIDSAGNVYVAGTFRGTADFGGGARTTSGTALFVASYTPDGTHRWAYVSPASTFVGPVAVTIAPDGARAYAVGYAAGADFGSGSTSGAFLLVLNGATGAYVGDSRFGSTGEQLRDAVADATGVTAVGRFDTNVSWGGPVRERGGSVSAVVVRFDRDGGYVSDHVFSTDGTSSSRVLSFDALSTLPTGDLVVGGEYRGGTVTLSGTLPAPSALVSNAFVARLRADGTPVWGAALAVTAGIVTVDAITTGMEDRVFAVGRYSRSLSPGTGDSYTSMDQNGYIVSYAADGTPEWSRSFGGDGGEDAASDVTTDSTGAVIVVGDFSTRTDFGGGARVPGSREGFLARYSATGAHQRDLPYGAGGSAAVRGVAVGPGNSTVIVGQFGGTTDLGSGPRSSNGLQDAFVLRLGT